jgi:hypothetical protein
MMPATMPYVADSLTPAQKRELSRWESRLAKIDREREAARAAYAAWIRDTGVSAVARSLGVTPGAMEQRVRALEGKRTGERKRRRAT